MSDSHYANWADTERDFPEDVQNALTKAGEKFIDSHFIGGKETDYLTLEGFNWAVVNELAAAGFRIVNTKENA